MTLINHCMALVRNLAASILVRASVSLVTFQMSTILAPLSFTNFECCRFQNLSISMLSFLQTRLACHGWSCWTTSKVLSSNLKKRHLLRCLLDVLRIKLTLLARYIVFFQSWVFSLSDCYIKVFTGSTPPCHWHTRISHKSCLSNVK